MTGVTRSELQGWVSRRRLLVSGVAASSLLAGCLGGDDGSDANGDAEDGPGEGDDPDNDDGIELPATGEAVPELEPLDAAMTEYMDELDLGAGTLAVARDGDLVFERGYGWGDRDRTEPVEPDAMARIGSISKLFTNEAILQLVDAGELDLDARVYPLLEVEPAGGELGDDRIRDITVEHLLNHAGGWNRFQHANPLYDPLVVVDELDLDGPPDRDDVIRYVLGESLQFEPGTDEVYSNIGYVLLTAVIEEVAGDAYQTHLEDTLFEPAGIDDIEIGRTRPENRHPDELWYDDSERSPSVFERDRDSEYSFADEGIILEAFAGAGGHVARSRSVVRAVDTLEWLWTDGQAHESPEAIAYAGSHPGSYAYVERRPDGITFAALFNGRHPQLEPSAAIATDLGEAIDTIDDWP